MEDIIYSNIQSKPVNYCPGATCGDAGDDSGLDGTWSFFCMQNVPGGVWIWDGSEWQIDPEADCSTLCSCCTQAGYAPTRVGNDGERTYNGCYVA